MSDTRLVPAGNKRSALVGLELPSPPPTRLYISGYEYRVQAPRIALPPFPGVVKAILNWVLPFGRIAKNIFFCKMTGSFVPSDPIQLKELADKLFQWLTTAPVNVQNLYTSQSNLQSVTVKDLGGTTAQATSSAGAVPGVFSGNMYPPSIAAVVSWQIAESYRGGKPRWYIPGIPLNANSAAGSPGLLPSYAVTMESTFSAFMNAVNTQSTPSGGTPTLGTVSYYHAHTVRVTPLFRTFINVTVHERLDSQRRRLGPEQAWPTVP